MAKGLSENDSFIRGILTNEQVESLRLLANNGIYKEDFKILKENYNIVTIDDLKIHRLVFELTPPMGQEEFTGLVEGIAQYGQIEPIKIWRKAGTMFVVDGRNRINALKVLGVKYVKYVEVNIASLEDLEINILLWDSRRNTSKSQKAVVAYYDWLENAKVKNVTKGNIAKKFKISPAYLTYCEQIDNIRGGGKNALNEMFRTKYITVGSKRYSSLSSALEALKQQNKVDKNSGSSNKTPESVKNIVKELHKLKDNDDVVGLSYIIGDAKKLLKQLL